MFKGFKFLLRYSWKFSKQYVICIFALQIISSLIPLLQVVLPKFILDELVGRQRMNVLILYVAMLVGYNLIGGLLVDFLRGKCFTTKGVVFTRFKILVSERLCTCVYEKKAKNRNMEKK